MSLNTFNQEKSSPGFKPKKQKGNSNIPLFQPILPEPVLNIEQIQPKKPQPEYGFQTTDLLDLNDPHKSP